MIYEWNIEVKKSIDHRAHRPFFEYISYLPVVNKNMLHSIYRQHTCYVNKHALFTKFMVAWAQERLAVACEYVISDDKYRLSALNCCKMYGKGNDLTHISSSIHLKGVSHAFLGSRIFFSCLYMKKQAFKTPKIHKFHLKM